MEKTQIQAAISSTLLFMPLELCWLIGDYSVLLQHKWNADGFSPRAEINNNPLGTELKLANHFPGPGYLWHRFVSEIPLDQGRCKWMMEWKWGSPGWFGFGITTSASNKILADDAWKGIAENTDFICINTSGEEMKIYHAHSILLELFRGCRARGPNVLKMWFFANDIDRTIRIRWEGMTPRCETINIARNVQVQFGELRPCVALAGTTTVVFSDKPDPCPDECCCEIILLF